MAEYIFTGSRFAWRDEDKVLHVAKRGDKVELTKEQAQRHRVGEYNSAFVEQSTWDAMQESGPEVVAVAVSNESGSPGEDGTPSASPPDQPATRSIVDPISSTEQGANSMSAGVEAEQVAKAARTGKPRTRAAGPQSSGSTASPTSSTETKPGENTTPSSAGADTAARESK